MPQKVRARQQVHYTMAADVLSVDAMLAYRDSSSGGVWCSKDKTVERKSHASTRLRCNTSVLNKAVVSEIQLWFYYLGRNSRRRSLVSSRRKVRGLGARCWGAAALSTSCCTFGEILTTTTCGARTTAPKGGTSTPSCLSSRSSRRRLTLHWRPPVRFGIHP